MPIDDFFLKRKRNLDVPVKKRPPRKRFRRRGPGLLTTDTDLQKRLTSLMCETNSEDLLKASFHGDLGDIETGRQHRAGIPFDREILDRLRPPASSAAPTDDKPLAPSSTGGDSAARTFGETPASSKLSGDSNLSRLLLTPPSRQAHRSAAVSREPPRARTNSTVPGRAEADPSMSSLPAFLRSKITGHASMARLLRKKHYRAYRSLLYNELGNKPDDKSDGENNEEMHQGMTNDDNEDTEGEEEGDGEPVGGLNMLLGAAEVMKKQENGSKHRS